jgi:hypothetical protein
MTLDTSPQTASAASQNPALMAQTTWRGCSARIRVKSPQSTQLCTRQRRSWPHCQRDAIVLDARDSGGRGAPCRGVPGAQNHPWCNLLAKGAGRGPAQLRRGDRPVQRRLLPCVQGGARFHPARVGELSKMRWYVLASVLAARALSLGRAELIHLQQLHSSVVSQSVQKFVREGSTLITSEWGPSTWWVCSHRACAQSATRSPRRPLRLLPLQPPPQREKASWTGFEQS